MLIQFTNKMGNTTYNKYKYERLRLLEVLGVDVERFFLKCNQEEFQSKLKYIKKCMDLYRVNSQNR